MTALTPDLAALTVEPSSLVSALGIALKRIEELRLSSKSPAHLENLAISLSFLSLKQSIAALVPLKQRYPLGVLTEGRLVFKLALELLTTLRGHSLQEEIARDIRLCEKTPLSENPSCISPFVDAATVLPSTFGNAALIVKHLTEVTTPKEIRERIGSIHEARAQRNTLIDVGFVIFKARRALESAYESIK